MVERAFCMHELVDRCLHSLQKIISIVCAFYTIYGGVVLYIWKLNMLQLLYFCITIGKILNALADTMCGPFRLFYFNDSLALGVVPLLICIAQELSNWA